LGKNKIEQAAGSGSESSTKIREKNSDNSDKFLKTEPMFEDKKKIETNVKPIKTTNLGTVNNKVTKIANYTNQTKTNYRNVSPLNNQQIMFNIKTKIDKKAFLNSSDIPVMKNENNTNYKNEKTTKNKHNYSKSIEMKEHNDNVLLTSANQRTNNKSPLPNFK